MDEGLLELGSIGAFRADEEETKRNCARSKGLTEIRDLSNLRPLFHGGYDVSTKAWDLAEHHFQHCNWS